MSSADILVARYNAAAFEGKTIEEQITNAIKVAKADGAEEVMLPPHMLPYNASLVTFDPAVRMRREVEDLVFDVKAFGVAGDGVKDDTAAWVKLHDTVPAGSTVIFPKGTYLGTFLITKRLRILGAGLSTILKNTGASGPVVEFRGADGSGNGLDGCELSDLVVWGTNESGGTGLKLVRVFRSKFRNIFIPEVGGVGLELEGALLNEFNNVNVGRNPTIGVTRVITGPTHGVQFNRFNGPLSPTDSNSNTFLNCNFEAITKAPGIGVDINAGFDNVFVGGTSENNTVGVDDAVVSSGSAYVNFHLEANGTDRVGVGFSSAVIIDRTFVLIGATTNQGGKLRVSGGGVVLDNNSALQARNAANTAGVVIARVNTSNHAEIGPSAGTTRVLGGAVILPEAGLSLVSAIGTPVGTVLFPEIADPAAPAADRAVLYTRDNGLGKTETVVRYSSGGVKVLERQDATGKPVPVVTTASLPAAGVAEDGTILIEDGGAGDRNLIIYAGGQRFRVDGGAAF